MKKYIIYLLATASLLSTSLNNVWAESAATTYNADSSQWDDAAVLNLNDSISGILKNPESIFYRVEVEEDGLMKWSVQSSGSCKYNLYTGNYNIYKKTEESSKSIELSDYVSKGTKWICIQNTSGSDCSYTLKTSFTPITNDIPEQIYTGDTNLAEFGKEYHSVFTIDKRSYSINFEAPNDKDGNPISGSIKIKVKLDNYNQFNIQTGIKSISDSEMTKSSDGTFEYIYKIKPYVPIGVSISLTSDEGYYIRNFVYGPYTLQVDFIPDNPSDMLDISGSSTDITNTVSGYEWKKDRNNWRLLKDGEYVTNDWAKVNGSWYWINADGTMKTGWLQQGDDWYFLKSSGAMAASEWVTNNGYWYYVTSSGRMAYSRWIQKPGTTDWYYVGASGQMLANRWMTLNGKSYYLKADGKMAANEYIQGYYVNANGEWVK